MLMMNVHLQEVIKDFQHSYTHTCTSMCMWLAPGMTECLPVSGVYLWEVSISKGLKNGEEGRQCAYRMEQQSDYGLGYSQPHGGKIAGLWCFQ